MRIRIQKQGNLTKLTNKPDFQPFKKGFVPAEVCFMTCYLHKVHIFFLEKFFVSDKDLDPDPHGSALVLLPGSSSALR
jgi:hypothetical protein